MKYSSRGYYMIKLIKITKQYILWAYIQLTHIIIIGISLLQEGWRWHCYSHPAKLCLSVYQVTFDYSTLKAHISKTANDKKKRISDIQTSWRKDSSCTFNIHAQRDAQKHCFIYPSTTLKLSTKCSQHDFFELLIINHIIWKHWSFYVIYNHHFSHLLVYMEKMNLCGSLCMCGLLEYFCEKKLRSDYQCKSHDHDHQWVDLVMAWLP